MLPRKICEIWNALEILKISRFCVSTSGMGTFVKRNQRYEWSCPNVAKKRRPPYFPHHHYCMLFLQSSWKSPAIDYYAFIQPQMTMRNVRERWKCQKHTLNPIASNPCRRNIALIIMIAAWKRKEDKKIAMQMWNGLEKKRTERYCRWEPMEKASIGWSTYGNTWSNMETTVWQAQ